MNDYECAEVLKASRETARRALFKRQALVGQEANRDYLTRSEYIEALTRAIDLLECRPNQTPSTSE